MMLLDDVAFGGDDSVLVLLVLVSARLSEAAAAPVGEPVILFASATTSEVPSR